MKAYKSGRWLAVAALVVLLTAGAADCGEDPVSAQAQPQEQGALPQAPQGKKWQLVWSDEFNGTALDWNTWECPEGPRRDGYWSKDDSYLSGDGLLVLRTRKDGEKFSSGAIRTRGKFEHAFGYWEARCRFHTQVGHWPAFWLYSPAEGQIGDGGRDGTEIDIMEKAWAADVDTTNVALHWDGYGAEHKSAGRKVYTPGVSRGFHTFGLWWSPEEYVFYVDGVEKWRSTDGGVCQAPLYVKLTDEIGDWAGDIKKASLPDYFYVDYVRVYDLTGE
ncbi:glycoside hydrolase family 16 protein [bacterium]|nr:glycoside hydrolase family 16 protein [bacterium]